MERLKDNYALLSEREGSFRTELTDLAAKPEAIRQILDTNNQEVILESLRVYLKHGDKKGIEPEIIGNMARIYKIDKNIYKNMIEMIRNNQINKLRFMSTIQANELHSINSLEKFAKSQEELMECLEEEELEIMQKLPYSH